MSCEAERNSSKLTMKLWKTMSIIQAIEKLNYLSIFSIKSITTLLLYEETTQQLNNKI